jgi:hypothetical protein
MTKEPLSNNVFHFLLLFSISLLTDLSNARHEAKFDLFM